MLVDVESGDYCVGPSESPLQAARLNLDDKSRTSRLPWRGQFSPQLVEYLLETICPDASLLLDPFCGSGTVLFEAAQRGIVGVGAEVNPAAWHLASLASLCPLAEVDRLRLQNELLQARIGLTQGIDLFNSDASPPLELFEMIRNADDMMKTCLSAAILLGMGDKAEATPEAISRGLLGVENLLNDISAYTGSGTCHLTDARSLPLQSDSVDAVITSPPYINVFNYHQNYRPAVELLGWEPLSAARSEIGANRKHRQNRFLTVIQYCLDMSQVLNELARVCKDDAPLVLVVGRESNVLGASFANSALLKDLLNSSSAFDINSISERFFTNRFGQCIFEDVIIARRRRNKRITLESARSIGKTALETATASVPEKNRATLLAAIDAAEKVQPSPFLAEIQQPSAIKQ